MGAALEDEERWLHHLVMRLRMLLRYTKTKEAQAILRETISDSENRLETLVNAPIDHNGR